MINNNVRADKIKDKKKEKGGKKKRMRQNDKARTEFFRFMANWGKKYGQEGK